MLEKDRRNATYAKNEAQKYAITDALSLQPSLRSTRGMLKECYFAEDAAEIILLSDPLLPSQLEVHCVVEDTLASLPYYTRLGYTIAIEPFDVSAGKCAVLQDARGLRICLFEEMFAPVTSADR